MYKMLQELPACCFNVISCGDMRYAVLPHVPLGNLRVWLAGVVWLIWWQTEYQSASEDGSEALSGGESSRKVMCTELLLLVGEN